MCEMERYQPFHLNSSLSDARWKKYPCRVTQLSVRRMDVDLDRH